MSIVLFWLLFLFCHFFKWFVAPQLWNWYHQQRKHFFFIGRWNHEQTFEIRQFENATWESNFDTMGYVWMGRWKYRKHKIFLFQRRTLLHIPPSIGTGWLLQKQLIAQEVIIVFDQMVKQNLSYIPCQSMRYLLLY